MILFVLQVTVIGRTKRMIAQHLNNSAICDLATCALHDHAIEFNFQRGETCEAFLYFCQLSFGNRIGCCARLIRMVREAEQIADCVKRKTKFTRMSDEG
ncbi:hypothetical protein LL06_01220 [Hoeflea sp. BAL378]|nr:hypothetical protein LL06_01220 [Hoeflea sp. BAL378]